MQSVVLAIHIMLAVAITILVLMQRSEGGALGGLGGGQGANGFLTGRQAGNLLTKLTSIFFACFIVTSLSLVLMAKNSSAEQPVNLAPVTSQTQGE